MREVEAREIKKPLKRRKPASILIRAAIIATIALIQVAVVIVPAIYFQQYVPVVMIVCSVLSFVALLIMISRDGNPSYKIIWAIILLLAPVFGWLVYIAYGRVHYTRKERARMRKISENSRLALEKNERVATDEFVKTYPEGAAQAIYLEKYANSPTFAHTKTQYFPLGDDMFPVMLEDLRSAEKFIYMEYFIVEDGEMLNAVIDILKEKAAQGLDVRFMYDSFGTLFKMPKAFRQKMTQAGIQCYEFGSFHNVWDARYNNRDHRKICVVDGRIGYTGGVNLADEYINRKEIFGHWKDTAIRIEGDAVYSMTMMFLSLWDNTHPGEADYSTYETKISDEKVSNGYVVPYTDYPDDGESVGLNVYLNMISHSHHYLYIMTPYLIIDYAMMVTLQNAAKCGVDVRIITPGIPDKRAVFMLTQSYYRALIEAGVKIYEYTPGFVHAKVFIADDLYASVGTINMDFRSLALHLENGIWMYDTDAIPVIYEDYMKTLESCRQITLEECKKFHLGRALVVPILRLLAPLM